MSTYQCSVYVYICDLKLEVIEKFQANNYRLPYCKKTVPFAHGNFRKFAPDFLIGPMVSAHGLGRIFRKAAFFATKRQGNLWSLYQNGILTSRCSRLSIRLNVH